MQEDSGIMTVRTWEPAAKGDKNQSRSGEILIQLNLKFKVISEV